MRAAGVERTLRGLRHGDQRELYTGLGLAALAYLGRTRPRRQLLYRKRIPEGSAVVIHHRRRGDPKIEVVKPTR
jgi:MYXO-CTERM domain-containing protein